MIDADIDLLERKELPTWEQDAAVRRELERLKEDVHRYRIAAGYDPAKAARLGVQVNERADRIAGFLKGDRCGGQRGRLWLSPTQVIV